MAESYRSNFKQRRGGRDSEFRPGAVARVLQGAAAGRDSELRRVLLQGAGAAAGSVLLQGAVTGCWCCRRLRLRVAQAVARCCFGV